MASVSLTPPPTPPPTRQVFDWHLGPIGKLCDLIFKGSGAFY
jgi:hypothetical protein